MKQFFGAFFGSLIGLIVATLLAVAIIVAVVKTSISGVLGKEAAKSLVVMSNTVLRLELNGDIRDREIENPFKDLQNMGRFAKEEGYGLNTLLKKIKDAGSDNNVSGIYLELKNIGGAYANITELRNALLDFKKSGKFIFAYGEYYGQREYYLASVSDKIFLNPQGVLEFKGLNMSLLFYKKALEKLGVEVQTFRHGKFKSAIEPLMLDKMSEANRHQSEVFLNSIWNTMLEGIGAERKITPADLNKLAGELTIRSAESAKENGLIDALAYEDEVLAQMKNKTGLKAGDKINMLDIRKYWVKPELLAATKDKIAVIYAVGAIYGGEGSDDEIGSDRISRAIKEARLDEKVKAIVFRVNSPGGSSLASDVIWREISLAKRSKPVIVSMGNYAASGGYYISCAADRIFAQPNTITGSIGVFGLLPNIQKALEQKLGITVDTVNTNKYSSMGSALMPLRDKEREYLQTGVEEIYDTFISKVANGRNMKKEEVDSIGQGRVWTGKEALEINLVDELGGLNEAISYAVKKVNVGEYRLLELPRPINPLDVLLGRTEEEMEEKIMKKNLGITYSYLKQLQNIISFRGVQARLPYEIIIE